MSDSKPGEVDFETALGRLEEIVDAMEGGEIPLAELITKFEEGNKLLKICQQRLNEAEMKIEKLKGAGTSGETEEFQLDAES